MILVCLCLDFLFKFWQRPPRPSIERESRVAMDTNPTVRPAVWETFEERKKNRSRRLELLVGLCYIYIFFDMLLDFYICGLSDQIFWKRLNLCPTNNFVRLKFCPTLFCPIRYAICRRIPLLRDTSDDGRIF